MMKIDLSDVPSEDIAHLVLHLLETLTNRDEAELITDVLVDFCNCDEEVVRDLCREILMAVGANGLGGCLLCQS